MSLTPKQQRFVEEYLVDLNATQAAIRAGYSSRSANRIATENLSKPVIREAIQRAKAERSQRTQITADRVLEEYARLAFSDPRDLFDDDGNLSQIKDLKEPIAAAIASMEVFTKIDETGKIANTTRVRLWNKNKSLSDLAKHLGLFEKNNRQKDDQGILSQILREIDIGGLPPP